MIAMMKIKKPWNCFCKRLQRTFGENAKCKICSWFRLFNKTNNLAQSKRKWFMVIHLSGEHYEIHC